MQHLKNMQKEFFFLKSPNQRSNISQLMREKERASEINDSKWKVQAYKDSIHTHSCKSSIISFEEVTNVAESK